MIVYLCFFGLFANFIILEHSNLSRRLIFLNFFLLMIATTLLVSFRFETGYDWLSYNNYFTSIGDFSLDELFGGKFEPLYYILNYSLAINGFSFQSVVIFSGLLCCISWGWFVYQVTDKPISVLFVILCFLMFTLFFSTIRQSIALSFFILFVSANLRSGKNSASRFLFFAVLSFLFQYTSLIYYVVYLLAGRLPGRLVLFYTFFIIYVVQFFFSPIDILFDFIYGFGLDSVKLNWYLHDRNLEPNLFDKLRIWVTAPVFFLILNHYYTKEFGVNRILCGFGILLAYMELIFIEHSVFRFRFYYFAFAIQVIYLIRLIEEQCIRLRLILIGVVYVFSFAFVVVFLNKQNAIVLKPYQFFPYYYLNDLKSTGQERYKF